MSIRDIFGNDVIDPSKHENQKTPKRSAPDPIKNLLTTDYKRAIFSLDAEHIVWLMEITAKIRKHTGVAVDRSTIIRGLIEHAMKQGINPSTIHSAKDVGAAIGK